MNRQEFFKQFYPDYQKHEAKMKALQSAWDKLSIFNNQPLSLPSIRIGKFEIMLEDCKGKSPKGNSVEINGKWYYDWNAAMSLELPDGYKLPTKEDWMEICNTLENSPERLQKALKLGMNGCVLGGLGQGSSVVNAGNAYYWSSTYYTTNSAYYLYFGSGVVSPQGYSNKDYGFSVRCLKNC